MQQQERRRRPRKKRQSRSSPFGPFSSCSFLFFKEGGECGRKKILKKSVMLKKVHIHRHCTRCIYLWHVFEIWHMCLKALIRNVTFPAVQNFLHIYAEQDLRAPNTVMEPWGLNKMSTWILMGVKLFAAWPPGGRTCFGKSMWMFNWDGHSQTARKRLEIKDIIYFLSPSQLEDQKTALGFTFSYDNALIYL